VGALFVVHAGGKGAYRGLNGFRRDFLLIFVFSNDSRYREKWKEKD